MVSILDTVDFGDEDADVFATPKSYRHIFDKDVDQKMKDGSCKFISRESVFHQQFPDQIVDLAPTEKEKKRMPHLLYWRKFGNYKAEPVFGPAITPQEEWKLVGERVDKKRQREHIAQTKKEVKEGKQRKLTAFFNSV